MTIGSILSEIDAEIARLQHARKLLSSVDGKSAKGSLIAAPVVKKRARRKLSAEARERIAAAQRKRWAAAKKSAK